MLIPPVVNLVALALLPLSPPPSASGEPAASPVFVSGQGGYHTYRIPAAVVSPKGMVLAFCEGRKASSSDTGDIDVVLRRSPDGGKTWQPMQVVADDGPHTIGNPCPVVDRKTGTVWLLLTRNHGQDAQRDRGGHVEGAADRLGLQEHGRRGDLVQARGHQPDDARGRLGLVRHRARQRHPARGPAGWSSLATTRRPGPAPSTPHVIYSDDPARPGDWAGWWRATPASPPSRNGPTAPC